jgi:hypothetical protein
VQLRLELQGEYRVPVDSRAELTQGGLLGDMVVAITPGSSTEVLRDGDVIQLERTGEGLFAAAGGMAERADLVLARAQQLLSEPDGERWPPPRRPPGADGGARGDGGGAAPADGGAHRLPGPLGGRAGGVGHAPGAGPRDRPHRFDDHPPGRRRRVAPGGERSMAR